MRSLLASEVFRLRKRLMPYMLIGLLAVLVTGLYLALWLVVQLEADTEDEIQELEELLSLANVLGGGLDLAYLIAGVMIVILGATLISSEYAWGTIRTILPRSAGRDAFIGAKLTVVAGFCVVLAVASLLIAMGASAAVTAIAGLDGDLSTRFILDAILALLRFTLALAPYGALGFMLALLTRSAAAGIGVGLAVLFLEEPIAMLIGTAGGVGDTIAELTITFNVYAVLNANEADPDPELFSAWRGAIALAAYSAIFVFVSFWRFRTRDVTVGD